MNIKIFVFSIFFVVAMQKIVAMEQNQSKMINKEIMDTWIFLLEGKYVAEETSCCGIGPWRTNKPVADIAEMIAQVARRDGLSEEYRARIVRFIREQEVLDGECCCNDQGQCPRLEKALSVKRAVVMEAKKDK